MHKTAGVLAWIKAVGLPDCTSSHCILHCPAVRLKGKKQKQNPPQNPTRFSIRIVLDEGAKFAHFIKPWPLSTVFLTFCLVRMENMQKTLLPTKVWWLSWAKALVWLACVLNRPLFSWSIIFTWKNDWQTVVIGTWVFGRKFLEIERGKPITSRKTSKSICWQW